MNTPSRRDFFSQLSSRPLGVLAGAFSAAAVSTVKAEPAYSGSTDPTDDIIWMSATKLAEQIRAKKVSAKEAVTAYYQRIDAVNPKINAVVQFCRERAYQEADAADAALASGKILGPLHGVPMTIKDSWDTAGVISTGGTMGRANFVPEKDGTPIARLRAAGAILLGKSNTPELTLRGTGAIGPGTTFNYVYGMTRNPYDVTRSVAGSTGGGAAIVAAGGSAFDFGSDFGGSMRLPSHVNGVVGIKPTSGRVSRIGHIVGFGGIFDAFQSAGPIGRRVEDIVTILPIAAGPDGQDAATLPMPWPDPAKVEVKRLRVGFYTSFVPTGQQPTPETIEAVRRAVSYFADLGATVTESHPPDLAMALDISTNIQKSDSYSWHKRILDRAHTTVPLPMPPFDLPQIPTSELTELIEELDAWRSKMIGWIKNFDVVLSPVMAEPAKPIGRLPFDGELPGFAFTHPYNLTGYPAAIVRAGTSPEGLPIGVQVIGQPWREDNVLAALAYIESKTGGWKRPAM